MQLVRFTRKGVAGWGFLEGDTVVDASETRARSIEEALADGVDGLKKLRHESRKQVPLAGLVIVKPLARPSKIIGLARNYRTHGPRAGEGSVLPILFGMVPSALIGPGEPIELPLKAHNVDWEVELGIVIGRRCRNVSAANALDHVAGYTIVNDISARDPEIVAGQLFRAKAFDTFKPIGPCITTVDELGDASNLRLQLMVNGSLKQDASTSDLIANVVRLVEFCSETFTLEPGDLIASGTPGGTGASQSPPQFLRAGDEVVCEVEGIGILRNPIQTSWRHPGTGAIQSQQASFNSIG